FGCCDMARVHVRRGTVRIAQMRDQRNAGGPEARIVGGAFDLLGELGTEASMHRAHMDADFLEEASAHQPDFAPALVECEVAPSPGLFPDPPGLAGIKRRGRLVLERLERRAELVAQAFEPFPGAGFPLLGHQNLSNRPVCRIASAKATAAAVTRLSERTSRTI